MYMCIHSIELYIYCSNEPVVLLKEVVLFISRGESSCSLSGHEIQTNYRHAYLANIRLNTAYFNHLLEVKFIWVV